MPVYAYKGIGANGRSVGGVIDADTPKGARLKLRRDGVFPTEVTEDQAAAGPAKAEGSLNLQIGFSGFGAKVKPQDLALITRQLATLVGAGLPLTECLGALIEQLDNARHKRILSQVRERVIEGGTLADAFEAYPRVFNELYVNMVRAGEASGELDIVLLRLAEYTERSAELRGKVRSALTYPVLMGSFSILILSFLLSYVVPRITRVFVETQQELPVVTTVLLTISDAAQRYWWVAALLITAAVIAVRLSTRTPEGRLRYDRMVLKIPYAGKLLKKVGLARFARTLSTLLEGGIPLLQSLDIVKNVVNNRVLRNAIKEGRDSIREEHSIADPLRRSGLFPPLLIHMIAVGEKSGELESMLARAADAYDNEVETAVATMSSVVEPVLIIFMGSVVLFIVMAILLPIMDMSELVH